ncbi:MAG: glycoside hydrolase family 2 protein, partial [Gemmatimonadota bacterium]|nr:glycoside hydrolase family 2 protein [Gemmatimonadota bacterium]
MHHTLRLALLVLLSAAITQQVIAQAPAVADVRVRYTINDSWSFLPGGVEFAEKRLISDAGWESVTLPHTWNASDPFDDGPSYRRGIGWYRRTLRLDDSLRGKRLFLYFEGVNQKADVFVNGAFAGGHRGGYTAFTVDVTGLVNFDDAGGENLIAVQVDNSHDPQVPPLSVGFALYGGIYRDVWLLATDPVHVKVTDHASPGVYISTPRVSRESAEVRLRGTVVNTTQTPQRLRVVSTMTDSSGARVASMSSPLMVRGGSVATFAQTFPTVRHPRLWSPDRPYLYAVQTEIYDGDRLLDRVRNPLGFRWFRFDPAAGFFLNGERLQLRGTNRHQDFQGLGSALSIRQHVRDLEIIKEMGANFLRLAHYPQDPAVLEAADRLGLLIWEEIPVVNYITTSEEFTRNSQQMLREMIRQHHNHPSVILWGTMNEVFLWSPEGARISRQTDTTYIRRVREFAVGMDRLARREDPSRYTAMAIHGSDDYDAAGIADIPQVLGLNVYSGWYGGTFDGFGASLDRRHARSPNQVLFISEYGSGSDLRLNALTPERFDHSSGWHRMYHESYLRQAMQRPYLSGTAIWNQFDFSQPHIGESMPNMNQKGMLTFDRRPKDVFYMYKANWNPEPMIHIASRDWTRRAGTGALPVSQPVEVYSNLERVELTVNGTSLGFREPDDVRSAHWDAPLLAGDNSIVARGEKTGRPYMDQLTIHLDHYPQDLSNAAIPFRELAVNVGSNAQYSDDDGLVWVADQEYLPGSFGFVGGERKLFPRPVVVAGSHRTGLLVTYREGLEGYRFDVPDGEYEVELN